MDNTAEWIVVWGLPAGESDRLYEQVLSERCRNLEGVHAIIKAARRDGWHGFRVLCNDGNPPDFIAAINQ